MPCAGMARGKESRKPSLEGPNPQECGSHRFEALADGFAVQLLGGFQALLEARARAPAAVAQVQAGGAAPYPGLA